MFRGLELGVRIWITARVGCLPITVLGLAPYIVALAPRETDGWAGLVLWGGEDGIMVVLVLVLVW